MTRDSLGPFQREYSAAAQGRYEVIVGTVLLLVVLGIGTLAMLVSKVSQPWLGILLIGSLAMGLGWYLVEGIRKLGRRVHFHANGMIIRDGGRTDGFRFEDVAALAGMLPVVVRGTPVHIGGPLHIELRDGRRFLVGHGYADLDVLANFLHEKVMAQLLPVATGKIESGQVADGMGTLQVNRTGLAMDGKSLPWSNFRGVSFTADDLIIQSTSGQPWASLKIARVPNANLFLSLTRAARSR